eukprot:CAMPEP_0194746692 /NCGR_PEP_ID=MMETSP0323_2-20130528/663_1 /TAXON_ID=2866 ORGANISM="Crypthecodinium cohnii, Strain Seligo" /NCGR_SAMPLE_ID=MMETSP0323_2 /ASSEMBLY_ACC=CAM_ASM_000346 /LENGTH=194 /DNA_ID=CAMNT_0039659353 /DNA_START=79 /DNA_END=663 /DNA_ORIENTATION=+
MSRSKRTGRASRQQQGTAAATAAKPLQAVPESVATAVPNSSAASTVSADDLPGSTALSTRSCPRCYEAWKYPLCLLCKGEGSTPCFRCRCTGRIVAKCRACNGTKRDLRGPAGRNAMLCSPCSGKGQFEGSCESCNGRGIRRCLPCAGRGALVGICQVCVEAVKVRDERKAKREAEEAERKAKEETKQEAETVK